MGTGWMKLQEEHRWFGPDSSLGREAVGRSGKAQGHVASQVYSGWRRIAQQIRGDVASPLILKEVNFLQMLCFLLALCDRGLPCSNMPGKLLQGRPLSHRQRHFGAKLWLLGSSEGPNRNQQMQSIPPFMLRPHCSDWR
eukprot:s691_g19.t2